MMRPKVLEENIDNFNSVTKDTIERLVKIKGTSGQDGEIPDLAGELSKWATESKGRQRKGHQIPTSMHINLAT